MTVIYKKSHIKNAPLEREEQITFFNQLRKRKPEIAAVAIHIKNEGKRTVQQIASDKAEGMVTGAPDIVICGNPTLLIELKRRTKSAKPREAQVNFLNAADKLGAMCAVCWGWEQAWEVVDQWQKIER